jgi:hypothetical protein
MNDPYDRNDSAHAVPPPFMLAEQSVEIAWNYLHLTGQVENPVDAYRELSATVAALMRQGVTSRLLLSNHAIAAYERARSSRRGPEAAPVDDGAHHG